MAVRRPLVVVNGEVSELPIGDLLPEFAVTGVADVQFHTLDRETDQTFEWVKPSGVGNVVMILIGAGANGTPGSPTAGGVGGGAGGFSKLFIQAQFLPETLDVIFFSNDAVTVTHQGSNNHYCLANYGQDSAGAALPSGGDWLGLWGFQSSSAGVNGAVANESDDTFTPIGAGGGGATYPTGNGSGNGDDGTYVVGKYRGGFGGGSSNTGTAGNGGNGAWYGCGGGGGGSSPTGTPGNGGMGGDAACWIISW